MSTIPTPESRCNSFGCPLPAGHNRGRADIPENHDAKSISDGAEEIRHCDGCGDDYDAFEESHAGHMIAPIPDDTETCGVWVAYYYDSSTFAVFEAELDAYRYAHGLSMQVMFMRYGEDTQDAVKRNDEEKETQHG